MLTLLAKLFKALNSDSAPGQVAFAFALSMVLGFTPFWSLLNLGILLIALLLRINLSAFIFGVVIFSGIGYLLDPVSIQVGEYLLLNADLVPIWTELYQNDWMRVLAFNNTLTLGGFVIAALALVPITLLSRFLIIQYRHRVLAYINRLKIVQLLKASKFYYLYRTFSE